VRTEGFKGALLSALLIASLMSLLITSAEAAWGQEIGWTRQFGSSDNDYAFIVTVDASGNVYVAGETNGTLPGQSSAGIPDVFVRKYDGSGNEFWTRQFGSDASDEASSVMADTSGNVYVVGSTGKGGALPGQTSAGELDAFIRKYDGSGNELWTRQFGTSDWDWTRGVAVDTSGDVYVAGWTYGALPGQISAGGGDAFLVKFVDVKPLTKWPLIAGIAGVIVIIGIVAALYMRRRKPRKLFFGS